MFLRPRVLPFLVSAAVVLTPLVTTTAAGAASAAPRGGPSLACPIEGCDPITFDHEATLTVAHPAFGAVSSDVQNGHQISCGATCSVTDLQTTDSAVFPEDGWFTYTLTASGGPAGYSPAWSGCDSVPGSTCVVANDAGAGRSVSLTWVDTTAPTVTFNPPARVGPSNYAVSASGSDNSGSIAHYAWTVDMVAQGASGTTLSLQSFSEGAHTVAVRSYDSSGNMSNLASATVVVDKSVSFTLDPVPDYVSGAPEVAFATEESGATFTCAVDDATPEACSSPWQAPDLGADGTHVLEVTVTDSVGNTSTQTEDVVLDTLAPGIEITGGPDEGATVAGPSTSIGFSLTEANPGPSVCELDGSAVPCVPGAPVQLDDLAEGDHAFTVTATDLAGHETVATRHFTRQRTATSLTASAKPHRAPRGTRIRLSATGLPQEATGEVVFRTRTGKELCRGDVDAGEARCRTSRHLRRGTYDAVAVYRGDDEHATSKDRFGFRITG